MLTTVPCRRCGQQTEMGVTPFIFIPGRDQAEYVDLCVNCEDLRETDVHEFFEEGWDATKEPEGTIFDAIVFWLFVLIAFAPLWIICCEPSP